MNWMVACESTVGGTMRCSMPVAQNNVDHVTSGSGVTRDCTRVGGEVTYGLTGSTVEIRNSVSGFGRNGMALIHLRPLRQDRVPR